MHKERGKDEQPEDSAAGQGLPRAQQELHSRGQGARREGPAVCVQGSAQQEARHAWFVDPAHQCRHSSARGKLLPSPCPVSLHSGCIFRQTWRIMVCK